MRETKFRPRRMNDVLRGIGDNVAKVGKMGEWDELPADVQIDAPNPPGILDVMTEQPYQPPEYEGGTGLLDPMTGEAIPITQVLATDVPPSDPIAAGIDVNALIKTASGVYYQYQKIRDSSGRVTYQPKQVQAPSGNSKLGKLILPALFAYFIFG